MSDPGARPSRRPASDRLGAHLPEVRERAARYVHRVTSVPERTRRFRRGVAVRASRIARPGRTVPGLLSIVVPMHNVQDYVADSLASVRFQEYEAVEIIVVDDASTDDSARIVRGITRRDPRVRLVSRPNGGPSAARNTGVAHARGEFLAFFDPDDLVSPRGYLRAIASLRETGSDFAVLSYDRVQHDRHTPAAAWIRQAHAVTRRAVDLRTFPDVMVNAVPWSKVYRRSFYDAAELSFPEGALYEDQPMTAAAFAKARAFDVLPDILVSWRIRGDQSSITQTASTVANLREQVNATAASLAVLDEHAGSDIGDIRATQLLAYNMPVFTRNMLAGDAGFYPTLRATILALLERGETDSYFHEVPALSKVLNRLIAQDRYDDAAELIRSPATFTNRFPTERSGDGFLIDFPVPGGIEPEYRRLADSQLDLSTRALRLGLDDGRLTVEGWAFIRNVDLATYPPQIEAALVGPGGRRVPLALTTHLEPRLDVATAHWHCDHRPGGFTAELDLEAAALEPGGWTIEVTIRAGGLERSGVLSDISTAGAAARTLSTVAGDRLCTLDRTDDGLVLDVAPIEVRWAGLSERDGALEVTVAAPACRELRVLDADGGVLASAATMPAGDGLWRAALDVAPAAFARPLLPGRLVAVTASGAVDVVADGLTRYPGRPAHGGDLHLIADTAGSVLIAGRVLCATDVEATDEEVVIDLLGPIPADATVTLASPAHTVRGTLEPLGADRTRVRFSLRRDFWGRPDLVVPQGSYVLTWERPGAAGGFAIRPSTRLWDRLPFDELRTTAELGFVVGGGPRRPLVLQVRPPLRTDERGARNQQALRTWALAERTDEDAVFFRSLYGEVTNCNGLGVHTELERRGAPLTKYWSVADRSVPVPAGGVGIVEGSREWHRAIASARYHMVNVHQLFTFTKSPGQVVIQTMHGYPYKQMGHDLWASRSYFFTAHQVASYDQRAREWDYFVSPATYATPLLREAFLTPADSRAEVLEIGYPRNDVLLSDDAAKVRAATRDLLGIAPHQKAVLYAPTYRDYLSSDDLTAERKDFLNAERASRLLGPDYVLLMRGHAFNTRTGARLAAHPRIIDVSDHPDINELILASDVGVLDYSSLRFDYALTDKPMIFLVPDLAQYDAARPGILDYAPTAPGPMVTTTREVVDLVRDLDGLATAHAADRERFRRAYADLDDGHASARLVDAVMVPRGDAPAR